MKTMAQIDEPKGCWNCRFAVIHGLRPKNFRPGVKYSAACNAPGRIPGGASTIVMIEPDMRFEVCSMHVMKDEL